MNLVLLTETIVKMVVVDGEAVSVKEYESIEENLVHLEVMVAQDDLGRVIGKDGKTIKASLNHKFLCGDGIIRRLEEIINANKIIRPAYKCVQTRREYKPLSDR